MPSHLLARRIHQDISLDVTAKHLSSSASQSVSTWTDTVRWLPGAPRAWVLRSPWRSRERVPTCCCWVYEMTIMRKLTLAACRSFGRHGRTVDRRSGAAPAALPRSADGADRSKSCRASTCWSTTPALTSIRPSLIWITSVLKRRCT